MANPTLGWRRENGRRSGPQLGRYTVGPGPIHQGRLGRLRARARAGQTNWGPRASVGRQPRAEDAPDPSSNRSGHGPATRPLPPPLLEYLLSASQTARRRRTTRHSRGPTPVPTPCCQPRREGPGPGIRHSHVLFPPCWPPPHFCLLFFRWTMRERKNCRPRPGHQHRNGASVLAQRTRGPERAGGIACSQCQQQSV